MRSRPQIDLTARLSRRYLKATKPEDPTRGWSRADPSDRRTVSVAYFGDCSFREMPLGHGAHTPPGFPRHLRDTLQGRGEDLAFAARFVPHVDGLPRTPEALTAAVQGAQPPDVLLVQIGILCAAPLYLLPTGKVALRLREQLARALGRRAHLAHRCLPHRFIRRFGRPLGAFPDPARLEDFLDLVERSWPATTTLVLSPYQPDPTMPFDPEIFEAVVRAGREATRRHGAAAFVDLRPLTRDIRTRDRCANGYNLGRAGHPEIAVLLDRYLLAGQSRLPSTSGPGLDRDPVGGREPRIEQPFATSAG